MKRPEQIACFGLVAGIVACSVTSRAEAQQLRSYRGSSGTLTSLGREIRFSTPVSYGNRVINQRDISANYGYSTPGMANFQSSGFSSGYSSSARRASGGGYSNFGSGGASLRNTFIVPFSSNFTVPLSPAPLPGGFGSDRLVEQIAQSSSYLGTGLWRKDKLLGAGMSRLDSMILAPNLLIHARGNTAPLDRFSSLNSTTTYQQGSEFTTAPLASTALPSAAPQSQWQNELIAQAHRDSLRAGWNWFKRKDYPRAQSAFLGAESAGFSEPETRAGQFLAFLAGLQFESAAQTLLRIVRRDGESAFTLDLDFSEIWVDSDAIRATSVEIENLVLVNPQSDKPKALLAWLRWYSGDRSEALRLAREIRSLGPTGGYYELETYMQAAAAGAGLSAPADVRADARP